MGTYTKGDKYEAAMAKLDAAPAASNIDLPAEVRLPRPPRHACLVPATPRCCLGSV